MAGERERSAPAADPPEHRGPDRAVRILRAPAPALPSLTERIRELRELGAVVISSGMVPEHFKKPEQVVVVGLWAHELGIPIMTGLQQMFVLHGHVGMPADLMLGIAQRDPEYQDFQVLESTEQRAEVVAQRKGRSPVREALTIEEARKILVWEKGKVIPLTEKDNWKSDPKLHLRKTATKRALRQVWADRLAGLGALEGATEAYEEAVELVAVTIKEEAGSGAGPGPARGPGSLPSPPVAPPASSLSKSRPATPAPLDAPLSFEPEPPPTREELGAEAARAGDYVFPLGVHKGKRVRDLERVKLVTVLNYLEGNPVAVKNVPGCRESVGTWLAHTAEPIDLESER